MCLIRMNRLSDSHYIPVSYCLIHCVSPGPYAKCVVPSCACVRGVIVFGVLCCCQRPCHPLSFCSIQHLLHGLLWGACQCQGVRLNTTFVTANSAYVTIAIYKMGQKIAHTQSGSGFAQTNKQKCPLPATGNYDTYSSSIVHQHKDLCNTTQTE